MYIVAYIRKRAGKRVTFMSLLKLKMYTPILCVCVNSYIYTHAYNINDLLLTSRN